MIFLQALIIAGAVLAATQNAKTAAVTFVVAVVIEGIRERYTRGRRA